MVINLCFNHNQTQTAVCEKNHLECLSDKGKPVKTVHLWEKPAYKGKSIRLSTLTQSNCVDKLDISLLCICQHESWLLLGTPMLQSLLDKNGQRKIIDLMKHSIHLQGLNLAVTRSPLVTHNDHGPLKTHSRFLLLLFKSIINK